ncbi:MAG TPA: polyphosphate kinase 2 family protein [Ignavibacteria bacterium]|nr:polyphosphate--nucleotide phosphotransferase [Bacteroidota bacterium]HRE09960.1 polyphosphate kinase 2 family protein [Ignavibacteria bacterium]HRF66972.1 polyphosphate kinase 2 family protein [Ignavibacteria bacterium]HRJ04812.1 polyphosphate kinase 2 family protein [Ignavibacteria bacterium]
MGSNSTDNNFRKDANLLVKPGSRVKLSEYDTRYTGDFEDKEDAAEMLAKDIARLAELQDMLYAMNKYSLLVVIQAMDAAGKDGTIKYVMTGVNPQGCNVTSFKQPSAEELEHDFLWRINKAMPKRGMIAIFNRSHYEEVLVTRVHPEYILGQNIPGIDSVDKVDKKFWQKRFEIINNFEKQAYENGTIILKFFLNVSKEEQKKRFLARIEEPEKNWKFSASDVKERQLWDKYMRAFEDAIENTSSEYAPWYIIPADRKWFMRAAIGDIIVGTLEKMDLAYPTISEKGKQELEEAKVIILKEDSTK